MNCYRVEFFFPAQADGRQHHTETAQGTSIPVAFRRAWWQMLTTGKFTGRKGLDNVQFTMIKVPTNGPEQSA